jgi:rubredoxin
MVHKILQSKVVKHFLEKWECTVCGYIYDPEIGDPEHGIKPGTPFENLPEDWTCPVCGAPKDQFVKKE